MKKFLFLSLLLALAFSLQTCNSVVCECASSSGFSFNLKDEISEVDLVFESREIEFEQMEMLAVNEQTQDTVVVPLRKERYSEGDSLLYVDDEDFLNHFVLRINKNKSHTLLMNLAEASSGCCKGTLEYGGMRFDGVLYLPSRYDHFDIYLDE